MTHFPKSFFHTCEQIECKLSGPGAEYGGTKQITTSGSKCISWHKHHLEAHKVLNKFNIITILLMFQRCKFILFRV